MSCAKTFRARKGGYNFKKSELKSLNCQLKIDKSRKIITCLYVHTGQVIDNKAVNHRENLDQKSWGKFNVLMKRDAFTLMEL